MNSKTLLMAGLLVASVSSARAESPRTMMFEFHGGAFGPDVDSSVEGGTPWADVFGESMTLLRIHLDYEMWQDFGTLALGGGLGYGWVNGTALSLEGEATEDEVGFNVAPFTVSLVYRFDWAAIEHGIPFVPYAKVGLSATIWWATDAKDDIANTRGPDGEERTGAGLTFGWHVGAGLHFLLDIFSSSMATQFDEESGVNNSYIFIEYLHSQVDDFGSDTSINLSADALSFGLAFEF